MKNQIRQFIYSSARNSAFYRRVWHPLGRLTALAGRAYVLNQLDNHEDLGGILNDLSPQQRVLHGPFEGMDYSIGKAAGSSFTPKIIGCYEQELRRVIEEVIAGPYTDIVDIGCAEGYYAVGFALKNPHAHVWAFDTDPMARDLCGTLARANGVEARLTIAGLCDANQLKALAAKERPFILFDCEGFELNLLTEEASLALRNSDFLIEVHDFINPVISQTLLKRLKPTHGVERIFSIADFPRPSVFPYQELAHLDWAVRMKLMAELRPAQMEWLWCRSKSRG